MSAATSPGTGLAYGLQRVCAAWGFARSSFYAMKSRQQATAERPPAKRSGTEALDLGRGSAGGHRGRPGGIPLGGRGTPQGLGSASGLSWHPCFPQAGAPGDALRNNLLSPDRCRRRGGNPHVGEIITHAPNLMWGTDGVRVHGGRRLGLDIHRHRALERRVRRLACVQARRPLRRPSADLHGACEAVCLDLRRCGAGAGLADGSRLPVSVDHFTNQIKFWGIQPSYAFVGPRPTASPRGSIARSRTDHPWPHLATSRSCGTPSAGSSNSTMPSGSWRRTAT